MMLGPATMDRSLTEADGKRGSQVSSHRLLSSKSQRNHKGANPMQTLIGVFRGPSIRQAELITTSSHPAIIARAVRDFIELDNDGTPELRQALREALGELQ